MICFFIKAISYLVFAAQGKSVLQTIVFSLKHYTENRYVKNIPGEYSYTNVTGAWCPEERQTSAIFFNCVKLNQCAWQKIKYTNMYTNTSCKVR